MDTLETLLTQVTGMLQKLDGLPATGLTILSCIVIGYVLRFIKKFPNDGIPVVVILWAGVFYPMIADDNNDITLRVWLVRNALIGLVIGFVAWIIHKQVLSRLEDKFGLFQGPVKEVPCVEPAPTQPQPPTTTP